MNTRTKSLDADHLIHTVVITSKVSDRCHITLLDEDDSIIEEHSGYVPNLPAVQDGEDYVYLEIDNATGTIRNWESVSTLKGLT